MKNISVINATLLAMLLLSFLITSCKKPDKPRDYKIEYQVPRESISIQERKLYSYSTDYEKNIGKDSVIEVAKKISDISMLPLDFNDLFEFMNGNLVLRNTKDPSASFEMDPRSGNIIYNGGLAAYKKDESTPDLLKGEKAQSAAIQHLTSLGLLPEREELQFVNVGGLDMGVLNKDYTTTIYEKLTTVRYKRKLSNLKVMGASRVTVNLGSKGDLSGLIYNWGEIKEKKIIEPGALISDMELIQDIEKRIIDSSKGAKRMVVTKAELVLYDDEKGSIEPAYHIETTLYYDNANAAGKNDEQKYDVPYDFYVPVVKNPVAFYPYMNKAKVQPVEKERQEGQVLSQKDD